MDVTIAWGWQGSDATWDDAMMAWLAEHAWWLAVTSMVLCVGGLGVGVAIVIRMPADYFSVHRRAGWGRHRHPVLRVGGLILKNIAGVVLLVGGIIMALPLVPGPGVLFILIGVSLLDVPGKRALERYIISRPVVLRSLNGLRARWNCPPLTLE